MPPETKPTQDTKLVDEIPAPKESTTAADHIAKAAEILEYDDTPAETKETPEQIAEAELAAKPKPKTEKKTQKAAKPVPEPTLGPPKEPKKTKRELFMEKADAESAYRAKEAKLKEREAAAQAIEDRYKDFEADPVKHLEKRNPRFFEEMVDHYTATGDTKKDDSEIAALRAELKAFREQHTTNQKTQKEREVDAHYHQQLDEGVGILSGEEFADVHTVAAKYEKFNGRPTDLKKALAGIWMEYYQQHKKTLTPQETCEILLEDAQADLTRWSEPQAEPPAETKTKKAPPPPGTTLTQQQETLSAPIPEKKYRTDRGRDAFIRDVAFGELEYQVEPDAIK